MVLVGQVSGLTENVNIGIVSGTINVMNVKLCMLVLLIELYLVIPLSVNLTIFQGQSNVKLSKLKILYSYLIKLKLCRIVKYSK